MADKDSNTITIVNNDNVVELELPSLDDPQEITPYNGCIDPRNLLFIIACVVTCILAGVLITVVVVVVKVNS